MKKRITLLKTMLLALFVLVGSVGVWGQNKITIVPDQDVTGVTSTRYVETLTTFTTEEISWAINNWNPSTLQVRGNQADMVKNFQFYNTSAISGKITKVTIYAKDGVGVDEVLVNNGPKLNSGKISLIVGTEVQDGTSVGEYGNVESDYIYWDLDSNDNHFRIQFERGATTGSAFISKIEIEYEESDEEPTPKVAAPTFNPTGGTYNEAQTVSISTTTEGATIYYTTDGSNPTTGSAKYTAPITINKTTTVKAIAVKSGLDNSSVATANYTIKTVTEVSNIAALRAAEVGGTYKLTGEALVTFLAPQNRNAKFIQDATGGVMVDDPDGKITTAYNVGDGMKGLIGKTGLYGGLLQFVPESDPGAPSSTGNTVTAKVVDLADLADYESQLVEVKNVTIDASGVFERGKDYKMNDEDNPILRTQYDLDYIGTPIPANEVNMVGVSIKFNETIQFVPRSLADIKNSSGVEAVVTPVITPSTGSYTEDQTVTITTATEGATIYYTTNGQTPTKVSNKYSAPFTVTKTTTIKAIAIKSGMEDSGVAESVITMIDLSGTVGKGTKDDPFTVADVFTLNNTTGGSTKFWVKAFVVGAVNDKSFPDDLVLEGPFMLKTNIVVANDLGEKESENMVPVQLPGNNVRDALNLIDNPEILHKKVLLYGTLERYFGVPGVKNVTDYVLVEDTGIKDLEIHNLYTTPGMIHFNATAGEMIELYNLAGQKLQNRLATEGLNSLPIDTQGVVILKVGNKVDKVIVR